MLDGAGVVVLFYVRLPYYLGPHERTFNWLSDRFLSTLPDAFTARPSPSGITFIGIPRAL